MKDHRHANQLNIRQESISNPMRTYLQSADLPAINKDTHIFWINSKLNQEMLSHQLSDSLKNYPRWKNEELIHQQAERATTKRVSPEASLITRVLN